jgi:hypothetical protein
MVIVSVCREHENNFAFITDFVNYISRVRQQLRRGGGGIDLFLQRVTLEDAGHYTCRSKATNVTFNFVVISN